MPPQPTPRVIVIPRERAVFRLDRRGRWVNADGPFRNPRIIEFFNASIRRDAQGYYVGQERDGICEKVYFPYEDTALFVREVLFGAPVELVLNTGARLALDPRELFIEGDDLYLESRGERIKFTERALWQLAERIESDASGYRLRLGGACHPIPERPAGKAP